MKLIFSALTRFGGLRCPSELTRLEWRDVDLPNGRMIIPASKTEHIQPVAFGFVDLPRTAPVS